MGGGTMTLHVWAPAWSLDSPLASAARFLERKGISISAAFLPREGKWPSGIHGGALFAIVSEARDMGRLALAASQRGMRGAVLYEDRYLVSFGNGSFQTDDIVPQQFALPPEEEWGQRESFLWYTGLLLYAYEGREGLLACMDEARKWIRQTKTP